MHTQVLTEELRAQLPSFVSAYLEELILDDCQFEENEQTRHEEEQRLLAKTTYAEVVGTIDHPYADVSKQVNLWIGSHEHIQLHLHVGGSGCWIAPDNHYIFFHPIGPSLLPTEPDQRIWWVISEGYVVYRVQVTSEAEVGEDFPDIG